MKLVFASDSFKGTLSSARICELLEEAALAVWPDAQCVCLPMADGGEGTLDAIARVRAGERTPPAPAVAYFRHTRTASVFLVPAPELSR